MTPIGKPRKVVEYEGEPEETNWPEPPVPEPIPIPEPVEEPLEPIPA